MKRIILSTLIATAACNAMAQNDTIALTDVVVTGTRNATDVRHLPMTVTVVNRETLTA